MALQTLPGSGFGKIPHSPSVSTGSLKYLGTITALTGAVMLLGWVLAIPPLTSEFPGFFAIKSNAALALFLTGISLLLLFVKPGSRWALSVARIAAGVVVALGALTLIEYLTGWNIGIDQFLCRDTAPEFHGLFRNPGRMVPDTAVAFTLIGVALLFLRRSHWIVGVLGLSIVLIGVNRVIALAAAPASLGHYIGIAIPTTILFLLLGGAFALHGFKLPWALGKGVTALFAVAIFALIVIGMLNYRKTSDLMMASREKAAAAADLKAFLILPAGTLLSVAILIVGWFRLNSQVLAVRDSEERFRLLVEAAQDYAIYILDPDGHIVTWNAGAQRIKGYRAEEVIGEHFSRFYPSEEIEKGTPDQELKMAAENGRFESEGVRVRKDGTRFWAYVTVTALRQGDGQLRGFSKITRDITARKEAEAAVRDAHLRATTELLEGISDSFVAFDRNWRYARVNSAAERLLSKPREELLGKVLWDVFPGLNQLRLGREFRRAMDENVAVKVEDFYPAPLNAWFEVRCYPTPEGLNVFFLDITERKNAEAALLEAKQAAEQANSAKDVFLATLSHELRTPLTPVLLTASSLESDETLHSDVRSQFSQIRKNIELEARLIDDLLDLTKIVHGKFSVRFQPCNVSDPLLTALEIVRSDYIGKRITVELDTAARSTNVRADPARLKQVFWNVLKNAIKFTPAGGRIHVRTFNPDPDNLAIEIRDTGIGIAPEFVDQVFQPFQQGAVSGKHQFGGLGLGLAITKAVVEVHGGTIAASSPGPGLGTIFSIQLPLCEVVEKTNAEPDVPIRSIPPRRILLVEDHESTRNVLARLLRKDGHCVEEAGSCMEALKAANSQPASEPFETLVCDLGLPDGTGVDVVRELKPRIPALFAVALSGFGSDEDIRRSMDAGFAAHLVKPVSVQELRRTLAA